MLHDPSRELRSRIEVLEEENAHLRSRIASLTGADDQKAAIRAFRLTPSEAVFLTLLVHRGEVSHEEIEDAIYSRNMLAMLNNSNTCVRSYAKRVRVKIRPHGIDFATVYGLGWMMPAADRDIARALLAEAH